MATLQTTTDLDDLIASLDLSVTADDVEQARAASSELQRQNEASAMVFRMFAAPTDTAV